MKHDDDRLPARISAWLSDELDPAAAEAVVRDLAGDAAGRRLAGEYRRVDEAVRGWYHGGTIDTLERRSDAVRRPLRWAAALVAAALLLAAGPLLAAGSARAFETAVDAAAAGMAAAAGDSALRLDRCSYWELRPMVHDPAGRESGTPSACVTLQDLKP